MGCRCETITYPIYVDTMTSITRILFIAHVNIITLFHIILLVDPFDPSELIDGIRQLYKAREGWLSPFPWCEEFHFQLDDIYTKLRVIGTKKTRGIVTDEVVDMSAIFKPHEDCSNPRTVLIEGKPGMGKTTYCKKLVYDLATEIGRAHV